MDDSFGHWLAGFLDGEGCFSIHGRPRPSVRATCRLTVKLRADDGAILEEIRDRTGCGNVSGPWLPPSAKRQENPHMVWHVTRVSDLLRMVSLLDRYPLRAKKARDYVIWREAIMACRDQDYSKADILRASLSNLRQYGEAPAVPLRSIPSQLGIPEMV